MVHQTGPSIWALPHVQTDSHRTDTIRQTRPAEQGESVATDERWLRRKAVAERWGCDLSTVPIWAEQQNVRTRRTLGGPTGRYETRYLEVDVERVRTQLAPEEPPAEA